MAERISHDVTPPRIGPDAREELDRLLQTMHEHGVLRFANDMVAANPQIAKVLVNGLSKEGSLNAIQNLSALAMALSTIPPNQFYKMTFALRDAVAVIGQHSRSKDTDDASPGVSGAYQLLKDEELWHAVRPLIEGLKAFGKGLDKDIDKPISDFTGKPTEGP
ncbi:DUF1641 domain-containing protein [Halomonas korlensis]|uniref:Uncharacterized conserved protein YjgD, DUF1641 family n=1 Tax=Halomonas korlensis TaxID=463301 RepID=A0A1I7K6B6_9GAMM|nr:DUF1641 domain-containing protein [Halomonas korlensis]SFU92892.1 Uncharacterized conserved protein YjgD, DUF1641 family [Halomonas korlensis]